MLRECSFGLFTGSLCYMLLLCLNLSSQNADSSFNKGRSQFEIGNYTKALEYFKETIALQKDYKMVNYISGLAEYNLQKYDRAIFCFDQEIIYNPTNSNAYLHKAISYQKLQKNELALISIETALKSDPDNVLLVLEKGHIYFNQKKYKEARTFYLKVLSLNDRLELAYYKLGFCEYYLKNNTNACNYWKNIRDIDDFENYETILKTCNLTH